MRVIGLAVVLSGSLVAPLVLAAPTDAAEPYTEESISLPSGGLTLRAVLARPYGDGPFAAYVHVHGSVMPQVANNPPWNGLAEGSYLQILAREGYVVLRLARRGHFGSEGSVETSCRHGVIAPCARRIRRGSRATRICYRSGLRDRTVRKRRGRGDGRLEDRSDAYSREGILSALLHVSRTRNGEQGPQLATTRPAGA